MNLVQNIMYNLLTTVETANTLLYSIYNNTITFYKGVFIKDVRPTSADKREGQGVKGLRTRPQSILLNS